LIERKVHFLETRKKTIDRVEEYAGSAILAFILIVLSYQVILRFIFHSTNSWSEELSRYMFVWFVYVTASFAIYNNAHIKIDAFVKIYPLIIRPYIKVLGNLIFIVYAIAITYYSADYVMDIMKSNQISLGLGIKMAYMYAAIPVGHCVMSLRLIQLSYKMLKYPENYPD